MPFFGIAPLPFFAELFRMDARQLLAEHTVLPYATAHSTQDVWERAVVNSLAPTSDRKAMGAVIQSAIHGLPDRRFCPTCVDQDIRVRGESYWHLSHQLPGSLVCPLHGDLLRSTTLRIAGVSASYELPQDCSGRASITGPVSEVWRLVAARVAELSGRGLEQPMVRAGSYYRAIAVERGWLRPDRAVDAGRLMKLVVDTFGKPTLNACGLVPSGKLGWPALMLQVSPAPPFSTLKHILMEQLLAGAPMDLSHKPSGPSARSRSKEDKELAAAFKRVASNYASRGQRGKVSTLLQEAGCWGSYRHSKQSLPRLRTAVEAFQTSQRAPRPQALLKFLVPGQGGAVATRQDLIKAGHLLCCKDAAARLGIHWYQMKAMQRDGRILSVRYAARDWYPAFWFDGRVEPSVLEAALTDVAGHPLDERWKAVVEHWASGGNQARIAKPTAEGQLLRQAPTGSEALLDRNLTP